MASKIEPRRHINLNKLIISKKIEAVINIPQTKKNPGPNEFTTEYHKTFKELTLMLLKVFHTIERKVMLLNSFYTASIILIPKPDKDTTKQKLEANILDECK
jgi:hypothetical protein